MLIIITTSDKPHKNTRTYELLSTFYRVGNRGPGFSFHYIQALEFQANNLNLEKSRLNAYLNLCPLQSVITCRRFPYCINRVYNQKHPSFYSDIFTDPLF